jgi:hypothetical protein
VAFRDGFGCEKKVVRHVNKLRVCWDKAFRLVPERWRTL